MTVCAKVRGFAEGRDCTVPGSVQACEESSTDITRSSYRYILQPDNGLRVDESFLPEELKHVIQGTGPNSTDDSLFHADDGALAKRAIRKYNLDDFLEVTNDEELLEPPDEEPAGPARAEIIRNEDDDELEQGARDDDGDEDLDEDDYGDNYFDNGEGEWDEYAEPADDGD